jgi:peptidylprolyl isomerase
MQEGEKRTLYIHPEFAYGTKGILPPNSLLTFEVEIVKANAAEEAVPNSLILESQSPSENKLDTSTVR